MIGIILSSVCLWCCALWLNDTSCCKVSEQVHKNCPTRNTITTFNPLPDPIPSNSPSPKFCSFTYLLCLDRMTIFYTLANCENHSVMAEYCYRGDDWRMVGCFRFLFLFWWIAWCWLTDWRLTLCCTCALYVLISTAVISPKFENLYSFKPSYVVDFWAHSVTTMLSIWTKNYSLFFLYLRLNVNAVHWDKKLTFDVNHDILS